MEEISNNSKFNICASFNLSLDDINCVSLLYQPLIGPEACALYLTLNSLILRSNLKSLEFNHIFLYDMLGIDSQTFLKRRKILFKIFTNDKKSQQLHLSTIFSQTLLHI